MKHKFLLILMIMMSSTLFAQQNNEAKYKQYTDRIDKLVYYGLKHYRQRANRPADDYTFVRRVYLDVIGRIPTYKELLAFKNDSDPDKRNKLIDTLIDSEGYVSHNFNYWADVLRITSIQDTLYPENYIAFVKDSLRTNKPYDQFVRELLTAKGDLHKPGNGATGYYMRDAGMPLDNMSNTMKVFLGTSMECAQCHDHPFDRWTQLDFYKLAAFTSGIEMNRNLNYRDKEAEAYKPFREKFKPDFDKSQVFGQVLRIKYADIKHTGTGIIRLPHDYDYEDAKPFQAITADVPFGPKVKPSFNNDSEKALKSSSKHNIGPEVNSRETFAKWVTSKENPMFTKTIVNRLWMKLLGGELIGDPINLSRKGKGINPYLTDELVKILQAENFNMKEFHRIVLRSQTYQRETSQRDLEAGKPYVFHAPLLTRLTSEQIWDSLLSLALVNPDASLNTKPELGGYDYLYTVINNLKPNEVADHVEKTNYGGRGDFVRKIYQQADEYNKKNAVNAKSIATNAPMDSSKKRELDDLEDELKKARKLNRKKTVAKIQKQISDLKKEMNPGADASMSMMNMGYKGKSDAYARASEISSPAPRGHFLRQFGQSERLVIDGASKEASIPQAFTLLNGKVEDQFILNQNSYIHKLISSVDDSDEKIQVAFLAILNREPKYSEVSLFKELFKSEAKFQKHSKTAENDLIWTLINTNEFIFRR